MTWTFRTAGEADIPAIVDLVNLAYRVEDFFINGNRTHEGEVREYMGEGIFLLAEDASGTVCGSIEVSVRGERGYFGMLSVHPSAQGSGLGRELIARAEAHAITHGCRAMDITYVNLRQELPAFYHRFGYEETGTVDFPHPWKLKQPAHLVTMARDLRPQGPSAAP